MAQSALAQQNQFELFGAIGKSVAEETLLDANKTGNPFPGHNFKMLDYKPEPKKQSCGDDPKKETKKSKQGDLEIILVVEKPGMEQGTISNDRENEVYQYYKKNPDYFQSIMETPEGDLSYDSINAYVNQIKSQMWYSETQFYSKEIYLEAIIANAAMIEGLTEKELASKIAGVISEIAKTDEEKLNMLNALSDRMYYDYNDSRNPGHDNGYNNPDNETLPSGSITLSEHMKAMADRDTYRSGVCNDVTENLGKIATELFKDKDVLALNSGTHFGLLLTDKNGSTLIDGAGRRSMKNYLAMDMNQNASNLRISKVIDGHLQEIAVMDTQLGELVNRTAAVNTPLLKSGTDFEKMILQFKKTLSDTPDGKVTKTIGVSGGRLVDSEAIVFAIKRNRETSKSNVYVASGASIQKMENERLLVLPSVFFRSGFDRRLISYIGPNVNLKVESGVHLSAHTGVFLFDSLGGNLSLLNKASLNNANSDAPLKYSVDAAVDVAAGPRNWGNTTGALSRVTSSGALLMLKNMTFHLNQVALKAMAERRLSEKAAIRANARYLGSNVGQTVNTSAGVALQIPQDAELFIYTGYDAGKLGGYKTKSNLLPSQNGIKMGVQATTKSGNSSAQVEIANISAKQSPQLNVNLTSKIQKKKKKQPVKTDLE